MNARPSLHPRHWGGWLSVFFIRLCAYVAPAWAHALSRLAGPLLRLGLARRRRIAEQNLAVCFPQWTAQQRGQVLRDHFYSLGMMLFESAWIYAGRPLDTLLHVEYHGTEHLHTAPGQPLLIVSGHMTCMDLGGCLLCLRQELAGVYRPLRSPVLEWYHTRGRLRYARAMLSKYDFHALLRHLNNGGVLWYAPDQDFGPQRSLFIPFFGQSAATLKATWLLARRTKAKVITMFPRRLAPGRYRVDIQPAVSQEGGADAFLTRINQRIEAAVSAAPEQYWWVHRRFKTRPPDSPGIYTG